MKKYKIIFVGDSGTGKSHLIYALTHSEGTPNFSPTIGVEFNPKIFKEQNITLNFWDTGGQ